MEGDYYYGISGIFWMFDVIEIFFFVVCDDDWEYLWCESEVYVVSFEGGEIC